MTSYPEWGVPPGARVDPISDDVSPSFHAPSMIRLRDGVFAFAAYMGGQIVGAFLFMIVVGFYWGFKGDKHVASLRINEASTSSTLLVVSLIFSVFCVMLLARYIAHRPGLSWRDLGFVMPKWRWFAFSFAAFLGSLAFSGLVEFVAGPELMKRANHTMDFFASGDQDTRLAMLVLICLIVPFIEELVFRAIIFRALANRLSLALASVLAVAIFSLVHAQYLTSGFDVAIVMMLQVGFMGALLVWLYHASRSLWPGVFMHAMNNGWVMLVLIYLTDWAA